MNIRTVTTPRIRDSVNQSESFDEFLLASINRHLSGDWGDVYDNDRKVNDSNRFSALGIYTSSDNETIWIKQDNNILTVMYLDEY